MLASTRNVLSSILLIATFVFFILNSASYAQDGVLDDSAGLKKTFIIQLSGAVLNENFTGARASLEIDNPNPDSLNSYLVVIRGFPKTNSRNTFYWHSDSSDMLVMPQEIVCDIKKTYLRPNLHYQSHFFYLSPILLKPVKGLYLSQREKERRDAAEKRALPTQVDAQAGQLKIRISGDSVSGSVWMKGYDLIEKSYVQYNAFFSGNAAIDVKPTYQVKEPQRKTGTFWEMNLKHK
jgi:hypothetical protein